MSEKCYLCGSTDGKCNHFPTPPASHDAGELPRITSEDMDFLHYNHNTDDVVALMREAAAHIATLTAEVARLTGELEKETAHSKHLAGAVQRQIQERIAAEDAAGKFRSELVASQEKCEEFRQEALRILDDISDAQDQRDASRKECERLREALASLIGATRHLNPCPGTMEQALAALSASGREGE